MRGSMLSRASVVLIALVMIGSAVAVFSAPTAAGSAASPSAVTAPMTPVTSGTASAAAPTASPVTVNAATDSSTESYFSPAQVAQDLSPTGVWNGPLPIDQSKATQVSKVLASDEASGIPASKLFPPNLYEPAAPVTETGNHIVPTFPYPNAPAPLGLGFYGLRNESGNLTGSLFNTTGVEGYYNTGDSLGVQSLYFDFGGQQTYGDQLNSVLNNVTLLGQGGYQDWEQNVINYNPTAATGQLTFDINIWNFSSAAITMSRNSIISPVTTTGSTYEASGSSITVAYPFSFALYINTTVNYAFSNSAGSCITFGCNEIYYNYSVWNGAGHLVCPTPTVAQPTCGTYDNVIMNSQAPTHHVFIQKGSAEFVANGLQYNPFVELPDDFEWDVGIGDSSGSQNNLVYADATLGLLYLNASTGKYQEVPSAYNYGSETGESGSGAYVGWNTGANGQPYGTMTTGPTLLEGLWNISGTPAGLDAVNYAGVTPGNAFIAYALGGGVTNQSMFKVAPSFGWFSSHTTIGQNTYLSPGVYTVEVLLSDYVQQNLTITVGVGGVTLSNHLVQNLGVGVYTPLWAFSSSDLANLSVSGAGTALNPYVMPSNQPGSMSLVFGDIESYLFPVWMGIYLNSTSAYVVFNPPPSLSITYPAWSVLGKVQTYFAPTAAEVPLTYQFQMYFYHASNVVVAHAASIGGWFSSEEVGRKYNVYVNDGSNFLFANDYFNVSSDGLEFLDGGTNNYVWGSTFFPWSDVAAYPSIETPSTGLTVSTSGNHIYNNEFYTNGTAASSASFTNFWNATGGYQPATNDVIFDGFNLTGSILGGTVQGGNYWFNYGALANPYGVLPYGARATSPTGTKAIGNGGDFAPLVTLPGDCVTCLENAGLYHVTFTETGLSAGASWTMKILGVPVYEPLPVLTYTSPNTNTTTVTTSGFWLPNGTYSFVVSTSPAGFAPNPAVGTVTVNGGSVSVPTIVYSKGFVVTFTESGLPTGVTWYVNITGQNPLQSTVTATAKTITVTLANGTYTYTAVSNRVAWIATDSGTFTVSGAALGVSIPFSYTYPVSFSESGLPSGLTWQVTFNGVTKSLTTNGGTDTLNFAPEANGTYSYTVAPNAGYHQSTIPYSGTLTVSGAPLSESLSYAGFTYSVTFKESGLPAGLTWTVTVDAVTQHLTTNGGTDSLVFAAQNGSNSYTIAGNAGWHQATLPYSGSVVVSGAAVTEPTLKYKLVTYTVKFKESGLPSGLNWTVTVNGETLYLTTTGGTDSLVFGPLVNGTYSYSVTGNAGWHQTALPYSGSVTVNGASVTEPTLKYKQVTYSVTFSESGIRAGLTWRVTLNGHTLSLTTNGGTDSVTFSEANGTYSYSITSPNGWVQSTLPTSGTVTVNGASVNEPTCVYTKV
jgi:thermopsin